MTCESRYFFDRIKNSNTMKREKSKNKYACIIDMPRTMFKLIGTKVYV
jgi:hypothetical protein